MKLRNPMTISLIMPIILSAFFAARMYLDDASSFTKEYPVVLAFILVFWLVTSFVGLILSQVFKKLKNVQLLYIYPQVLAIALFLFYAYSDNKTPQTDIDDNKKWNHLMVDYEKSLDDSLITFPNHIRIGYQKLESQFSNPNEFRLTSFGSERIDSSNKKWIVYFTYTSLQNIENYSKVEVINDTPRVISFNMSAKDSDFLVIKHRLDKSAFEKIKKIYD